MPVNRTPANGASSLECVGDARNAEAQISVSRTAIAFGTIPHPGSDTESFAVTNTGEKGVQITIAGPPPGSDFTWAAVTAVNLPVGTNQVVTVTFTTPGDFAATPRTITVNPSEGTSRTVSLSGAGCIANAVMVLPPVGPVGFGQVEQGFRTVRFREVRNTGDGDLTFAARVAGPDAALFGLVLPGNDITDALPTRTYTVAPPSRCGSGPTGSGVVAVAVSFFADAVPSTTPYTAQLEIDNPVAGTTAVFALDATVIAAVPVDAVVVLDRSGSMGAVIGARSKMEAALAGGNLFVQLLRDSTEDRAAVVRFNENPEVVQGIVPVAGNRAALSASLSLANFNPDGSTNVAGGVIVAEEAFNSPAHPSSPPDLKKAIVVLTDGLENRCFQIGGAGPWYSITGRDPGSGVAMSRPDGTDQDTDPLPTPAGIKVYAIGLGNPDQIDGPALDDLSMATGGYFDGVEELIDQDYFLLEKYFTQIFMDAVDLAMILDPFYTIVPGEVHKQEFDIFPGDVNAMVVIYDERGKRLPFYLVTPRGEQISSVALPPGFGMRHRSTETARMVEVKFPKGEPERYAGRWQVVVAHEGRVCGGDINLPDRKEDSSQDEEKNRQMYEEVGSVGFLPLKCRESKEPVRYGIAIGAGSNLRMQAYVEPGLKYIGDTIRLNAGLAEAGLPVKGSTVRVTVESPAGTTSIVNLKDDGQNQDGDANDGDYGGLLGQTPSAGVYKFNFRAEGYQAGWPYVREAHRTKLVYDRRKPPNGNPDGGGKDCCKEILRAIRQIGKEKAD